ncbi:MAG: hypothetical protein IPL87_02390 [Candidatus Moraniibacteriota bacterium]|nr:MAG: hypothetical protein IPL87_02390 [Candidatus Moranbacteria bacterium]
MIPLHRMILETVVYYDVFDYPLTEFEVWQLLIASDGDGEMSAAPSLREVGETLDGSFLSKRLSRSHGFVFVRGRERLVFDRIQKGKRADRDIRRAKRVARVFSALPL